MSNSTIKPKTDTCHCGSQYTIAYDYRTGFRKNNECPSCSYKLAISKPRKQKQGNDSTEKPKKQTKRTKWQDKPLNELIQYVQEKLCNPYIRERDKTLFGKCISSNGNIENAGHYFAVGGHEGMRFRVNNIHGQSTYSNKHKHGDLLNYREGLIKRHGQKYVDQLELDEKYYKQYGNKFFVFDVVLIGKTYKYLLENKIWIFDQKEFDNWKEKIVNI